MRVERMKNKGGGGQKKYLFLYTKTASLALKHE